MTKQHKAQLDAEVRRLLEHGAVYLPIPDFYARWNAAGFRFDHSCDIRQFARIVSGPFAGELCPELTLYPIRKETGLSAFHVSIPEPVRAQVRELRRSIFAVSRDGYILTV